MPALRDPQSVRWFGRLRTCHWCGIRYGTSKLTEESLQPFAGLYCHVNCRARAHRWRLSARQLAIQLRLGIRPARTPRPWFRERS